MQNLVKEFLVDHHRRHLLQRRKDRELDDDNETLGRSGNQGGDSETAPEEYIVEDKPSYIDMEKAAIPSHPAGLVEAADISNGGGATSGRLVNVRFAMDSSGHARPLTNQELTPAPDRVE